MPYGLKVLHGDKSKIMNTGQGSSNHWIGISSVWRWHNAGVRDVKPFLIPLYDLKSQTLYGWSTCPAFILRDEFNYDIISSYGYAHVKVESYPYRIVELLFKWHFDVFGLIDQGLALPKDMEVSL